MKKHVIAVSLLATALALFLVVTGFAYVTVSSEGYSTIEVVRNYLIRDGKVEIVLPSGVEAVSVKCSNPEGAIKNHGSKVEVKLGYSESTIEIECRRVSDGQSLIYRFTQIKYNNWNRIRYIPKDKDDDQSGFDYYENGVKSQPKRI